MFYCPPQGFLEVETPVLEASAGGADARPFVTYHNTLGRSFTLRIATELHLKRLVVRALTMSCCARCACCASCRAACRALRQRGVARRNAALAAPQLEQALLRATTALLPAMLCLPPPRSAAGGRAGARV